MQNATATATIPAPAYTRPSLAEMISDIQDAEMPGTLEDALDHIAELRNELIGYVIADYEIRDKVAEVKRQCTDLGAEVA